MLLIFNYYVKLPYNLIQFYPDRLFFVKMIVERENLSTIRGKKPTRLIFNLIQRPVNQVKAQWLT